MSALSLLRRAAADGVHVDIANDGKLRAFGSEDARAKWVPILRDHKHEILASINTVKTATPPSVVELAEMKQERPPQKLGGLGGLNVGYDPVTLQREADRRNARAVRERSTGRWCACGSLAESGYPDGRGGTVWRCWRCFPVLGRA